MKKKNRLTANGELRQLVLLLPGCKLLWLANQKKKGTKQEIYL